MTDRSDLDDRLEAAEERFGLAGGSPPVEYELCIQDPETGEYHNSDGERVPEPENPVLVIGEPAPGVGG